MASHDVVVIGGGISGLAFAHEAATAGCSVLVLERAVRLGGCISTHRTASGFWFELGAHTCYNSYAFLARILERCGLREQVVKRDKTRLRFLDGDALVPGSNLGALLRLLSWGEVLRSLPRSLSLQKDGQTVYAHYTRLVGRKNYGRVLGPMLSAVSSQSADAFPATMLFKSHGGRRQDFPRSFTLRGGLQSIVEALAPKPGIEVKLGVEVASVHATGRELAVVQQDGARYTARVVALATPPASAVQLLRGVAPELARQVSRVRETTVDTLGVAVPAAAVELPTSSFLIPRDDVFHSVVSRDPVPDPAFRGFAFHFKAGLSRDAKIERATRLLGIQPGDLEDVVEKTSTLPSPVLGHEQVVCEIDRLSKNSRLCVTGNWFTGLSLEDCVERSTREWKRVVALG
jgi:UDP-galactopyranose mutase